MGRLISDKMSYRNHYMCSGEATTPIVVSVRHSANGSTNPEVFQPKTFLIPRGIIPQNFSSLGFAVSEEIGNKQTSKETHSLTDRLVL